MRTLHFRAGAGGAIALLLLVASAAVALMVSGPAAVIVSVSGAVNLQRAGASATAPATVGTRLMAGDRVVPAGGQAVLLFRTGRKVTASAPTAIEEPSEAAQSGLFTRSVGTLTRVASTDASEHPNRQGMIRPIAGSPAPIAPRNDIPVLSTRPTFSWFSMEGVASYTLQLRRVDGPCAAGASQGARPAECRPLRYPVSGDTTWTVPADAPELVRGASYEWTVSPGTNGRVAVPQHFRVLDDAGAAALDASMSELRDLGLDVQSDGLFMLALAYRDAGLMYEARDALARLEAAGMGSGAAYFQLKGEVLDALGDLSGAETAFAAAEAAAS